MTKIREILNKYKYKFIDLEGDLTEGIEIANFDKLEEELQELFDSVKGRKIRFKNKNDVIGI